MSTLASLRGQLAADADLHAQVRTLVAAEAGRELTDLELEQVAAGKQLGEGLGRVGSAIGTGIANGYGGLLGIRNT
jgi:hypothetical protein